MRCFDKSVHAVLGRIPTPPTLCLLEREIVKVGSDQNLIAVGKGPSTRGSF